MRKLNLFFLLLLTACSSTRNEFEAPLISEEPYEEYHEYDRFSRPKLVVGIVVDQMRYDFLYRYWDRYGEGGFKRLVTQGFSCENTNINYVPTYTAPGHAAIYTGTTPSVNGIVANDWFQRNEDTTVYCVHDSSHRAVGIEPASYAGRMSPHRLLTNTVTDELRYFSNNTSRTVGIALKDRGAILPAGRNPSAAYWYDGNSGNWITSTYYSNTLPTWVQRFNSNRLPDEYLKKPWNTLYDITTYTASTADDVAWEGAFKGESKPVFPHNLPELKGSTYNILRETPWGNTLTKDFAVAAIENMQLGQGEATDFLCVSFSSTDYIGHRFGPNSIETEDTYLRLDQDLTAFLDYLDGAVGLESTLIFLTADHGVVPNPAFSQSHRHAAGYLAERKLKKAIDSVMTKVLGTGKWISAMENGHIYLDHDFLRSKKRDPQAVATMLTDYLITYPGIGEVFTATGLKSGSYSSILASRIANGYMTGRSGDVVIALSPGWLENNYGVTGTSHGTGYRYDTHIPLVWYGWHIYSGSTARPVTIADIAPTVAALLHISPPNAATGEPVWEMVAE